MKKFVTLTKEEFEDYLPENYIVMQLPGSKEYVYHIDTIRSEVAVVIYSTVDIRTGTTRDLGKDAIRVVYWDKPNDKPLGKGKKILRVEGTTSIGDRIRSRINEFLDNVKDVNIIDWDYVRAVLENSDWSDFACSLLENLDQYKKLTDKQLAYVLGDFNPRGKKTFEAIALGKDANFYQSYCDFQKSKEIVPDEIDVDYDTEQFESVDHSESYNGTIVNPEIHDDFTDENVTTSIEIVNETQNLLPTNKYKPYQYPFETFNPVQSAMLQFANVDCNIVVGANTSAGKTVMAEFVMDEILKTKKIVYTSPLKSLSREKYDDWQKRFADKKIVMLTGDTLYSKRRREEEMSKCLDSNIIICTSELLDSVTRHTKGDSYKWIYDVGLLIVDEAHTLCMEGRGHAIEAGIMRFTRLNNKARVVLLSATMPNVPQLAEWLETINDKSTKVVQSTWRPVKLSMHYVEYQIVRNRFGGQDYWATQNNKKQLAYDIILSKPNEKFLLFVHDKNTGRAMEKLLKSSNVNCFFHNADKDSEERISIEDSFKKNEGGVRVLISTSTLAYGRNLPARNVVILGVHRGLQDVDELDIIQEAGRAGRVGFDERGDVYLIIPEGTSQTWGNTFLSPKDITSTLNNHKVLGFHILAEMLNKTINDPSSLLRWYQRSLAFRQDAIPFTSTDAHVLYDELRRIEMIDETGKVTGLGKVSAWLYYSPETIYAWYKNFGLAFGLSVSNFDDNVLAWAMADEPENDKGYVPRELNDECSELSWKLNAKGIRCSDAIDMVFAVRNCLAGVKMHNEKPVVKAMRRTFVFDVNRIVQALSLIDGLHAKWGKEAIWVALSARVKYGIPAAMTELVRIKGVGGVRAKMLWELGFHTVSDIAKVKGKDKKILASKFGTRITAAMQQEAKTLI